VIVDLYPFEETVASTKDENAIIEKIDIGGISLIRAAAKNYKDVVVVPSQSEYPFVLELLKEKSGFTDLADRKKLATHAFGVSSHYDVAIYNYFAAETEARDFKCSVPSSKTLRYGENPHQEASFYGDLAGMFDVRGTKEVSFNNLVDIDAAVNVIAEFKDAAPTFAILKHTNTCGLATRASVFEAWEAALACDNISAFGGILISNVEIDLKTAEAIDKIFYEVLIAPSFSDDAMALLSKKGRRILLTIKNWDLPSRNFKTLLNGVIAQDKDLKIESEKELEVMTNDSPSAEQMEDLLYANICAKHLKSNTIALVKNKQMIGMGCGQTSRVDACIQAIEKAQKFGFDLNGAVMASDAFFPFPDCVELAHKAGIVAVIQPAGSKNDQASVDYCNTNGIPMVKSGTRHFKH